jgi:hypothetical protein
MGCVVGLPSTVFRCRYGGFRRLLEDQDLDLAEIVRCQIVEVA